MARRPRMVEWRVEQIVVGDQWLVVLNGAAEPRTSMTPERWLKVKDIFHAALERAAEERAAFLDETCAGDDELRAKLERMLVADAKENLVIDSPAVEGVAQLFPREETESIAGRTFGHYRVEREIGRGGMGRVYLAQDTRLGRRVALKLLPDTFTKDAERVRRFQQEARVVSALNHPNIITIHEIGETDGKRFIVTEFVEGETLREIIARGDRDLSRVLKFVIQVAEALASAHGAGMVHRDIKPENIMVRADGYVKVLDFGLAKPTEERSIISGSGDRQLSDRVVTTPGLVLGTVKYMSPEQARGYEVDARTDIFSLGVVLYEAVTGCAPFQGKTAADVLIAIAGQEPPPLAQHAPEAPARLQLIIDKSLRKNRDERYQTIEEMRRDLEELSDALTGSRRRAPLSTGATGMIPARTTSSAEYFISEIKRRRRAAVALAGVMSLLLLGLGLGAFLWVRSRLIAPPLTFGNIQFLRLTNQGIVPFGTVSPDGKYLGYAIRDEKGGSFWLKQIASDSTRLVFPPTGPVELWGAGFSSDSNYFYYLIEDLTNRVGGVLYRVPVLGGEPHRVMVRLGGFAIAPNGRRMLIWHTSREQPGVGELAIVDLNGANERIIMTLPTASLVSCPWSPDGNSVSLINRGYDAQGPYWNLSDITVADAKVKPILTKHRQPISGGFWLPDRSGLFLTITDETMGVAQVWYLSYPDGTLRRVTHDVSSYTISGLTADGKSLLAAQSNLNTAIWTVPVADPAGAHPITMGLSSIGGAAETPDGKIIYSLAANSAEDLWEIGGTGSQAKQLTFNAGRNYSPSVSADGRYIVFVSTRTGRPQIWRIERDGGNAKQLSYGPTDISPSCSPTASWVVFASQTVSNWSVWKVALDGGEATKLSDSVETAPTVSPDGRLIAYEYFDETSKRVRLAVQPLDGGPARTIADSDSNRNLRWTSDGTALCYVGNQAGRTDIWAQPLAGGAPRKLTDFKTERIFNFDWSRDGKQLICVRGRLSSDLVLISNFK
jgi:serine/threonine protein kinase/Tol biopolymer transport system component